MHYGNLVNIGDKKAYPEEVYKALEYLKDNDFTDMAPGRYEIDGKDIFFLVQHPTTDFKENIRPESHKDYIDIQLSLTGGETIGFATLTGNDLVDEDLLDERDIVFYKLVKNERFIKMEIDDFFVFYPWDIHRPCCADDKRMDIKKVVVKINMKNI